MLRAGINWFLSTGVFVIVLGSQALAQTASNCKETDPTQFFALINARFNLTSLHSTEMGAIFFLKMKSLSRNQDIISLNLKIFLQLQYLWNDSRR